MRDARDDATTLGPDGARYAADCGDHDGCGLAALVGRPDWLRSGAADPESRRVAGLGPTLARESGARERGGEPVWGGPPVRV